MFKRNLSTYKFPLILFLSIIIGSIIGIIMKEDAKYLEPIGQIFINMLFVIVVPLVFSTIASSIAHMESLKRLGKIFKYMIIIFIFTSLIASVFMMLGVLIFPPTGNIIANFDYTKETIYYISKKYNVVPDVAKIYIENQNAKVAIMLSWFFIDDIIILWGGI